MIYGTEPKNTFKKTETKRKNRYSSHETVGVMVREESPEGRRVLWKGFVEQVGLTPGAKE